MQRVLVCALLAVAFAAAARATSQDATAACLVDDRAAPPSSDVAAAIFPTIQEALDSGTCQHLYVRHTAESSFFEEDLGFAPST